MADDYRIPVGFQTHPKTVKLRRRLGAEAVLAYQQLIAFCAMTAGRHKGSLAGMTAEDIAIAAGWEGDADQLVTTLRDIPYLDGEDGALQMHEFEVHQPHIAGQDAREAAARHAAEVRWGTKPARGKRGRKKDPKPAEEAPSGADEEEEKAKETGEVVRIDAGRMPPASKGNAPTFLPTIHPSFRRRALRARAAACKRREESASGIEGEVNADADPAWRPIGTEAKQLLLNLGLGG